MNHPVLSYTTIPDFRKSAPLRGLPRLTRKSFWYVQHVDEDHYGPMAEWQTGENRNTGSKTCHSATWSTTNLKCIELGPNPGLGKESSATNRLSHIKDELSQLNLNYLPIFSSYRAVNTQHIRYKKPWVRKVLRNKITSLLKSNDKNTWILWGEYGNVRHWNWWYK
jgi:hypothetical protein